MVVLATERHDDDAASDSDDDDDDDNEDDASATDDVNTFDLLHKIGILSSRTKFVYRYLIISKAGALVGLAWVFIFSYNAVEVSPGLLKFYEIELLCPTFVFVALVGSLLTASVCWAEKFMQSDQLKACVQSMQEGPVKGRLLESADLVRRGKAWQCQAAWPILMQVLTLGKWLLVIFVPFSWAVEGDWRCMLASAVVFVFLSCVSDAYMFGQSLAEAVSEAMVWRVIWAVRGAKPGHDWSEAIQQYQKLREQLEGLWEKARFIYVFYGLALAISAFLFTCWLFLTLHRPIMPVEKPDVSSTNSSGNTSTTSTTQPAVGHNGRRLPMEELDVQPLVGCLFFLAYCFAHLGYMIWRLGSITRLCQSTAFNDNSIINAALEKYSSLPSAEERRDCKEYVQFLTAAPTGVRIFFLCDLRLMATAGIPMASTFVSCVSYTLVKFELNKDDYKLQPHKLVMAGALFFVLALWDVCLRKIDSWLCAHLREPTD